VTGLKNILPVICVLLLMCFLFSACASMIDPDLEIASQKGDPKLCEKLQPESKKDMCFTNIAISKKSVDICQNMPVNTQGWFNCIKQVAVATRDKKLCEALMNYTSQYENCQTQVNNALGLGPDY
jgi:hypothetical protein